MSAGSCKFASFTGRERDAGAPLVRSARGCSCLHRGCCPDEALRAGSDVQLVARQSDGRGHASEARDGNSHPGVCRSRARPPAAFTARIATVASAGRRDLRLLRRPVRPPGSFSRRVPCPAWTDTAAVCCHPGSARVPGRRCTAPGLRGRHGVCSGLLPGRQRPPTARRRRRGVRIRGSASGPPAPAFGDDRRYTSHHWRAARRRRLGARPRVGVTCAGDAARTGMESGNLRDPSTPG